MEKAARWVNRSIDVVKTPTLGGSATGDVIWGGYSHEDAAAELAQRSSKERQMAKARQDHDLAASSMTYDVTAAELSRDFGIGLSHSTVKDPDGRVSFRGFEIIHSKFGKLGEVRNGQLYIATDNGDLVDRENFFTAK